MLAILNTAMTFGILIGVWLSYLKPNAGLKEVLGFIRKTFIFLVLAAVVLLGRLADSLEKNE